MKGCLFAFIVFGNLVRYGEAISDAAELLFILEGFKQIRVTNPIPFR